MSAFLSETMEDAQTSITSLAGAIAGSVSDKLGRYVIRTVGISQSHSLGDVGLRFVVRALVSSAVYAATVRTMPESSQNILFTLLYFGADSDLTQDAITIGRLVTKLDFSMVGTNPVIRGVPPPKKSCSDCK